MRGFCLLLVLCGSARGQILYLQDTRTVTSHVTMTIVAEELGLDPLVLGRPDVTVEDHDFYSAFGPVFSAVGTAHYGPHNCSYGPRLAHAEAWQESILTSNRIVATGGVRDLDVDGWRHHCIHQSAHAESLVDIRFRLDSPQTLLVSLATQTISGSAAEDALNLPRLPIFDYPGSAEYSLTGPNVSIIGTAAVSHLLIAQAGDYHLRVLATGYGMPRQCWGEVWMCGGTDGDPDRTFSVDIQAVPEPHWLGLALVLPLVLLRRHR